MGGRLIFYSVPFLPCECFVLKAFINQYKKKKINMLLKIKAHEQTIDKRGNVKNHWIFERKKIKLIIIKGTNKNMLLYFAH